MDQPEIVIIAALTDRDRVIGNQGRLPWSIPADLARFKALTWGHTVVLGRRTWELDLQCRVLPGRQMVILSRQPPADRVLPETVQYCADWRQLLRWPAERLFIAGGAQVYAQLIAVSTRWELTLIDEPYAGDTYFPDYTAYPQFVCTEQEAHPGYRFTTWQRRDGLTG